MKKTTLILALSVSALFSGCATTKAAPEVNQICENISEMYVHIFELKAYGANKGQAFAFMEDMTKDIEPKEMREFISGHAQGAVNGVYDNPNTSKKDWKKGIKRQCIKDPSIISKV